MSAQRLEQNGRYSAATTLLQTGHLAAVRTARKGGIVRSWSGIAPLQHLSAPARFAHAERDGQRPGDTKSRPSVGDGPVPVRPESDALGAANGVTAGAIGRVASLAIERLIEKLVGELVGDLLALLNLRLVHEITPLRQRRPGQHRLGKPLDRTSHAPRRTGLIAAGQAELGERAGILGGGPRPARWDGPDWSIDWPRLEDFADHFRRKVEGQPVTTMDFARPIGIGPHFSVHVVTDKEVLLLSEQRSYRLQGKLYVALMPFLDGRRTGEEIICAFAGRISRERLRKVLADLVEKNYACHLDSAAPTERQALWAEFGLVPAEAERNLLGRAVAITATTDRGPAAEAARLLRQALIDSGVSVAGGEAANLVVVSVDDYLTPELEGVNARMRKEGRSWIPFKGAGAAPMLGPLFHPHAAPCWRCLAAAMIENRPGDTVIDNGGVASRPARGFTVATLGLAATFSALEIARSLAQPAPSSLERNVLALDLKTRSLREHFVRAQTNCT